MAVNVDRPDLYLYADLCRYEELDDGSVMVYGYASSSRVDLDKQIADPDWLKQEMPEWMLFGNIREMHWPKAVGKAKSLTFDETGPYIASKIIDPDAVKKVKEGIYNGYSIGVKKPVVVPDPAAPGGRIVGGKIIEVSLVDYPANIDSKFALVKSVQPEGSWLDVQRGAVVSKSAGSAMSYEDIRDKVNQAIGQNFWVVETYPDYVIVQETWPGERYFKLPYKLEGDTVTLGTWEEVKKEFVPAAEAAKMAAVFGKFVEVDLAKGYTRGSYEYIRFQVARALEESLPGDKARDMDMVETFPDYCIVHDWREDKYFKIPYTIDGEKISLGTMEEVERQYVPASSLIKAAAARSRRKELKEAAEARAKKYGIAFKEGKGHLTPPKGYPENEEDYGDPVNYAYPIDEKHIRPAVSYFNQEGQREAGGYTVEEWAIIGKRIAARAGEGYKYEDGKIVTPSTDKDKADKAAAPVEPDAVKAAKEPEYTGYCMVCKKEMAMHDVEIVEVKGRKGVKGTCSEGHDMYRFLSKEELAALDGGGGDGTAKKAAASDGTAGTAGAVAVYTGTTGNSGVVVPDTAKIGRRFSAATLQRLKAIKTELDTLLSEAGDSAGGSDVDEDNAGKIKELAKAAMPEILKAMEPELEKLVAAGIEKRFNELLTSGDFLAKVASVDSTKGLLAEVGKRFESLEERLAKVEEMAQPVKGVAMTAAAKPVDKQFSVNPDQLPATPGPINSQELAQKIAGMSEQERQVLAQELIKLAYTGGR